MAITELPLRYGLNHEQIFQIAKQAGLERQSRIETVQCWDMIQIWQEWINENFGMLTGVRHRSQPHDPPDLELVFERRTIGMEHTRLQPKHLGQAEALMRETGMGGFIPSISSPPKDFHEMKDIVAGAKHPWSTVSDDWRDYSTCWLLHCVKK